MYVHSSCLSVKIISPHMTEDLISAHNKSLVLYQILQKLKFLSGKLHLLISKMYFMTSHRYSQFSAVKLSVFLFPAAPAKHCFYSCNKLHHTKRLCDIVVRSGFQSPYLVKFRILCRNHDHRDVFCIRRGLQPGQNAVSVLTRKHDIQKDQGRKFFFHG